MRKTALVWCWLALLMVVLDQGTKHWVLNALVYSQPVAIFPSFNLTLLYNQGAAFSFLSAHPEIAIWLFSGIAVVVSGVLLYWLTQLSPTKRWMACGLSLILGGGIGNLIDRIRHGHVVDFLDFYWGVAHFPAFNIADAAITVGAVIVLVNVSCKKEES